MVALSLLCVVALPVQSPASVFFRDNTSSGYVQGDVTQNFASDACFAKPNQFDVDAWGSATANRTPEVWANARYATSTAANWGVDPRCSYATGLVPRGSGGVVNTGAPILDTCPTCVNKDATSVTLQSTRYWEATNSIYGNMGASDYMIEALILTDGTTGGAPRTIAEKWDGSIGWRLQQDVVANRNGITMSFDGVTTYTLSAGAPNYYSPNTWYHWLILIDRQAADPGTHYAEFFVNGRLADQLVMNGVTGNMTNASFFRVGTASADGWGGSIAFVGAWNLGNVMTVGTSRPLFGQSRFQRVAGTFPRTLNQSPVAPHTRGSSAVIEKKLYGTTTRKLYRVGRHWPRIVTGCDSGGKCYDGYLGEYTKTNAFTHSWDFAGSVNWVKTNATVSGTTTSPVTWQDAQGIVTSAASGDVQHCLSYVVSSAASSDQSTSVYVKAGARTWVRLATDNGGPNIYDTYLNLSTGALGSTSPQLLGAFAQNMGLGWYRLTIAYTNNGATSRAKYICPAQADGDYQYVGADTQDIWITGAQQENGAWPSSYIETNGAAVARFTDDAPFLGAAFSGEGSGRGSGSVRVLCPSFGWRYENASNPVLVAPNDSTAANKYVVRFSGSQAAAPPTFLGVVASASVWSIPYAGFSLSDGVWKTLRWVYQPGLQRLYGNRTLGAAATSATTPGLLNQTSIGADRTATYDNAPCILAHLRLQSDLLPLYAGGD